MRILLLFPPAWTNYVPYLGVPLLTAYLEQEGFVTSQRDLSVEFQEYLTSESILKGLQPVMKKALEEINEREILPTYELELYQLLVLFTHCELRELSRMAQRSPRMRELLNMAVDYAFGRHRCGLDGHLVYTGLSLASRAERLQEAMEAPNDTHNNLFIEFSERVLPSLLRLEPDLVGLSIISHVQFIPSLTLAKKLKISRPEVHIVIGGPWCTLNGDRLAGHREFFSIIDSVIIGEGEIALRELATSISEGKPLNGIPGRIGLHGDTIVARDPAPPINLNRLPTPNYDGFPLDKYEERILPLQATRGCFWGRCAFCTLFCNMPVSYRIRNPELVVEDLRTLRDRYNPKTIMLSDVALRPDVLETLSEHIISSGLDVSWYSIAGIRPSARLVARSDIFKKLRESGCWRLSFGIETGVERLLTMTNKGTSLESIGACLERCSASGIRTHVFIILGFPTETLSEARETLRFIKKHSEHIDTLDVIMFRLERGSTIANQGASFGISILEDGRDFPFLLQYKDPSGMSDEQKALIWDEASKLRQAIRKPLPAGLFNPSYSNAEVATSAIDTKHKAQEFNEDTLPSMGAILNLRPRVRRGHRIVTIPFDLLADATDGLIRPGHTHLLVYSAKDANQSRAVPLGELEKQFLVLCDGRRTIGEIVDDLANRMRDQSIRHVLKDCIRCFCSYRHHLNWYGST